MERSLKLEVGRMCLSPHCEQFVSADSPELSQLPSECGLHKKTLGSHQWVNHPSIVEVSSVP